MSAASGRMPITIMVTRMITATTITTATRIRTRMARTAPHNATAAFAYLRDPEAIYRRSFALIRREVDLASLPPDMRAIALRLVHTTGEPAIIKDLVWSKGAAAIGRKALAAGAEVLVDAEMVAAGITKRHARCYAQRQARAGGLAKRLKTTRSAAAIELWRPKLVGAIVAIGNAPTALFHLLEMIAAGAPRPALILGFPVGFVGAAESKACPTAEPLGRSLIALSGRRGGSALAAAAVNALETRS